MRRAEPPHLLVALAAAASLTISASIPIRDPDVWWHRWIGEEVLTARSVSGLGNAWAPLGDQNWTTTQWLSEVLLALLVRVGGWDLVTGARLAVFAGILVLLAFVLLPGQPARTSVPVYALVLLGLMPFVTLDRPQTLAIALSGFLAHWLRSILRDGNAPSLWLAVPFTIVWANMHGSWLLVPGVFALVTIGAAVSERRRQAVRQLTIITASTLIAGFATPAGAKGVLALPRFVGRTTNVVEWQPTAPLAGVSVGFGILVLMLLWALFRRDTPVDGATATVSLGLVAFGLLAIRNVPFALVLLAPILVDIRPKSKRYQGSQREQSALQYATLVTVGVGVVTAVIIHSSTDATAEAAPRAIAEALAAEPDRLRVLNSYGAAGVLVEFSGDNVELGIDGRADRYPAEYTRAYLEAQRSLAGWRDLLETVDPDVAVLDSGIALATHLQESGWSLEVADGDYVLLSPPPDMQ